MQSFFVELLFPAKCGFCGKLNTEFLCKKCEIKIQKENSNAEIRVADNTFFKYHLYSYLYQGTIRKKMIDFKFNDQPELANTFVKLLLNNKKICGFLKNYDIIIPVPMHQKKEKQRGYNQSALIAKKLAAKLNIDYAQDILYKHKQTLIQSKLNRTLRKTNPKGAYNIKNLQKIKEKKIILFDDIYTTGSTVTECSKILKQAKPKEIAVFTIAKD